MDVGKSTVDKWARQLRQERNGHEVKTLAISKERRRIRDLERENQQLKAYMGRHLRIIPNSQAFRLIAALTRFRLTRTQSCQPVMQLPWQKMANSFYD